MFNGTFIKNEGKKRDNLLNKYINFNKHYVLDKMDSWAIKPENVESIIKHTLVGLYLSKQDLSHTESTTKLDDYSRHVNSEILFYFLETLVILAQNSPDYAKIFQKVYEQDFKGCGLFGQALFCEKFFVFKAMLNGFNGKINFSKEDLFYLTNHYKNNLSKTYEEDTKLKLKLLFEEHNYIQLPKELRQFILNNTQTEFLEPYKEILSAYEKKIETLKPNETSVIQDIETEKIQSSIEKISEAPNALKNQENLGLEKTIIQLCENKNNTLSNEMIEKLYSILQKAQIVYSQIDKLSIEQTVDFKNYMEVALPKYLSVFSKTVVGSNQDKEFLGTVNLLNNYLDATVKHIEAQQTDEFLVCDTYFKNKLARYKENTELEQTPKVMKVKS